jgi:hypothetical protein
MNQEEMSRLLCGIVSHVTSMEKDYGDARKTLQELGLSDEQMVLFGFPKLVMTVLQEQQKEEEME